MKDNIHQVIRDRQTEEKVRRMDTHEIVSWIHELEDNISFLEKQYTKLSTTDDHWSTNDVHIYSPFKFKD